MAGKRQLVHRSLFSGFGGFDLAAEWCGWKNAFHCEINEFCSRILQFYWPGAASIKNIKKGTLHFLKVNEAVSNWRPQKKTITIIELFING